MPYKDNEQQRERQRQWFQANKEKHQQAVAANRVKRAKWFLELKKQYACDCGESHPACLDFHHVEPETKVRGVSEMVASGLSEEKILTEIAKCKIMCSNCHRKSHWNDSMSSGKARCTR